jgi:hypothetical protein
MVMGESKRTSSTGKFFFLGDETISVCRMQILCDYPDTQCWLGGESNKALLCKFD